MPALESRVRQLQATLPDFNEKLKFAWDYASSDAPSSLTKCRLIMEAVLLRVYQTEMGREPKKPLLGDMLTDNQFTRKLGRRIVVRMNAIRELGNLGAHGITVAPDDAIRVLEDLCTVLEWYRPRYLNGSAAPASDGAAKPAAQRDQAQDGAAGSSSAPLQAILSFTTSAGEERRMVIGQEQPVVAGRLTDLAMVFDHPTVSKRHAEFRLNGEGLSVYDLDSKNHVFVNGEQLTFSLLNRGDVVHLSSSGPAITVVEAPIVWPQTASDMTRAKHSGPRAAAARDLPSPAAGPADPTEVDEPAQAVLARDRRNRP